MTDNHPGQTRALPNLLNKLPAKPQITSHGYVDRAVDRVWVVGLSTLIATTHSLEIATNNPAWPEVVIVVGANRRDLMSTPQGAPNFNFQEVTHLPNSYFLQYVAHEYSGVMIQVCEEIVLSSQSAGFMITHPLYTRDPTLAVFDPALRVTRERPLPMPEGSSDRLLEPIR